MSEELFHPMRLVGGTSLALQYGHRQSIDLDFFGDCDLELEEVKNILRKYGTIEVVKESTNIKIYFVNGIKVDFVNYHYRWIDDIVDVDGLRLASPKDIAAMKINAIEGRGTKKDFIDVYFLLQYFTLTELLGFYCEKYPENSVFRALMSLSYFDDAEFQILPKMFVNVEWNDIKKNITQEVIAYQ